MLHQLVLHDVRLNIRLGHLAQERALPQSVLLQIRLRFAHLPLACTTDSLHDTICYASLADDLQKFCDHRSFKLIESFAYQLYLFLQEKIEKISTTKVDVSLCVTKDPSLMNMGHASFEIAD